MNLILSAIDLNATAPINCQVRTTLRFCIRPAIHQLSFQALDFFQSRKQRSIRPNLQGKHLAFDHDFLASSLSICLSVLLRC